MSQDRVLSVPATVHGRALVRASAAKRAPLLVLFHGYGENAEILLEAAAEVPGIEAWHLASIQALHPFYNRRTGDVIASWMTKLDRERAIADNVAYVGAALARLRETVEVSGPTVFLGFSQGTSMAYRAAALGGEPCDAVVALAGDLPPDLFAAPGARPIPRVLIGLGSEDTWFDREQLEIDAAALRAEGTKVETCRFSGGHEWTAEFRRAAQDFLADLVRS